VTQGPETIGFVESVLPQPNGAVAIVGWTSASTLDIVLSDQRAPLIPLLSFTIRPDGLRPDVTHLPHPGFYALIGPGLLALLPPFTEIRVSAGAHELPTLGGDRFTVTGTSTSRDVLDQRLREGCRWHNKTGDLYLPIGAWPQHQWAATLDLLHDLTEASGQALLPTYGTLLGIARNRSLIPHDDDVDAGSFIRATTIDELADRWATMLVDVANRTGSRAAFSDDLFHVWLIRGDAGVDCWPIWVHNDGSFVDVHAEGRLDDFGSTEATLEGRTVWIPRQTAQLLAHCYGPDYLEPNPSWRPERVRVQHERYTAAFEFREQMNRAMVQRVTIAE